MSQISTLVPDLVYRRIGRRILPIALVMFMLALWDRGNVSLAALQMNADLGLSAGAFGLGAGLFFALYAFLEVPSNIILAKVGARLWMSRIMLTWGLITLLTAFVQNEFQFYAARILLGVAEAGFFPGMIVYLSAWYPDGRRGRAISIFGIGAMLSPLLMNPLSGLILQVDAGLPGWRWLFVTSGVLTIIFGFVVLKFLPASPAEAKWLSADERALVEAGGAKPEPADAVAKGQLAALSTFIRRPGLIAISVVLFVILASGYAIQFFVPTILAGFGDLSPFVISLLTAIPPGFAVIVLLFLGRIVDRTRAYATALAIMLAIAAAGIALLLPGQGSLVVFIVGLCAFYVLAGGYPVAVWALVTSALSRPQQAAAVIALINSIGITGGFVGPFVFGWVLESAGGEWQSTVPVLLVTYGVCIVVVAAVGWSWRRRKHAAAESNSASAHLPVVEAAR